MEFSYDPEADCAYIQLFRLPEAECTRASR